jgi:predicted nucleotidyltransferase
MSLLSDISLAAPELCKQFGISRLSVFGSVARGDVSPESDIDFVAEFQAPNPDTMPDRYFGFLDALTRQFGRPIQLLTPRMIRNPHLRKSINRDLVVIYE